MTSFSELLSIFALAFVLGALLPFAVRPILHRYNMVDVPNERSSHTAPTYRGMGLATAAATFVAFVVATLFGWTYRSAESLQLAVTIAAAILCALALGWLEDIRGVSIVRRAGPVGALGITLGFLIIYICFTLGVLVMLVAPIFDWGVPKSLVVSYLVKIALLGLVLMFVPFPENLRHGWTLAGACTGVILWIVIETVSIARLRILYFDTDSEDHGR